MMPRPEVVAFLRDAKENPDDNTPLLVLADWLDDHGDPRGEFVRLQVTTSVGTPATPREHELQAAHRAVWLGKLDEHGNNATLRRGLVDVGGPVRKLLSKTLAAKRDYEPPAWVDALTVYDPNAEDIAKLAASPHWGCVNVLDLRKFIYYADHLGDPATTGRSSGDWSGLAGLETLPNLRRLGLAWLELGADGMRVFSACPPLPRLRELDLSGNNLGDRGMEAFTRSEALTGLTSLDLNQNRLRADGFAALAAWPGLSTVRLLRVNTNYPGAEGIAALADSPHTGAVVELRAYAPDFAHRGFGPPRVGSEGAAALARAKGLRSLQQLTLVNHNVGPAGAEALASSEALPLLRELDLAQNRLGDAGASALANAPRSAGLKHLGLRYNDVGDAGARALTASPYLDGLERLDFRANRAASPEAMTALRDRFGERLLA